ncbi:MAG: tyrosine-protein phosphatase [Bdellovibrionota bacterium]
MIIYLFLQLATAFALVSPFPSEVENLNIPNSHIIEDKSGTLIRGMRPRTYQDISELLNIGITDVIVFKDSKLEDKTTEQEITMLEKAGMKRKNITVIPFRWKEAESFETACLQTMEALTLMREVAQSNDRNLFFHCTVGEDRTGYLSAMYRILYQGIDPVDAWKNEMCENGYAEGNPQKPAEVVAEVHKNVSVIYQKMLHKVRFGYISGKNLDKTECSFDPERSSKFKLSKKFSKCKESSKYDPTIE